MYFITQKMVSRHSRCRPLFLTLKMFVYQKPSKEKDGLKCLQAATLNTHHLVYAFDIKYNTGHKLESAT